MQSAFIRRDYDGAAPHVVDNVAAIPGWVEETRREYGTFDPYSIPSLEQGGRLLALLGDSDGLLRMKEVVESIPELEKWTSKIERHQYDLRLFKAIQEAVAYNPNCRQVDVRHLIGEEDGRRVAHLIAYLEKAGRITRTPEGRTYRLQTREPIIVQEELPKRAVGSHRIDESRQEAREIDVSSLPLVSLVRLSPLLDRDPSIEAVSPDAVDFFEVRDADWRIISVETLYTEQRPDPAFDQMYANGSGLFYVDGRGRAKNLGHFEAYGLRYDKIGNVAAKRPLEHDVYRVGMHPLGRGFIAMSRDCVLHAYDEDLCLTFETALKEAPEIQMFRTRYETPDEQLKYRIRCVALSESATRYLFTAVDEAWCVDARGVGLWGVKLPFQEGWIRSTVGSDEYGMSAEVEHALSVMGLSMPVTSEDIRRRYRELARQYHPDINFGDSGSGDRMVALNLAAETLTGVDLDARPGNHYNIFTKEEWRTETVIPGSDLSFTIELGVGALHASDWIYAASFAGGMDSVYLGSYSGHIILVDHNGRGEKVYDVGSVPRRIIDTGVYLYILTDNGLYVVQDDVLHALIHTFNSHGLVVAQSGFAIVEGTSLRYFREDGYYLGSVVSTEAIRRVYPCSSGIVIETGRKRAVVSGVPALWD